MNLTPLYELKERLENLIFAGTSLAGEDFKLKRAYENFLPLAELNPVFAKIKAGMEKVFAADKDAINENLLDVLSLVDAVAYTQAGAVQVDAALEPVTQYSAFSGKLSYELPYSAFKKYHRTFNRRIYNYYSPDDIELCNKFILDYRFFPIFIASFAKFNAADENEMLAGGIAYIEKLFETMVSEKKKHEDRLQNFRNLLYFYFLVHNFDGENSKALKSIEHFVLGLFSDFSSDFKKSFKAEIQKIKETKAA